MTTYQDYIRNYGENPSIEEIGRFVQTIVSQHKQSKDYENADMGYRYYIGLNDMAMKHEQLLTTVTGELVTDIWSPNHRTTTSILKRFIEEEVLYLLGNGVNWNNPATNKKLGKRFDDKLLDGAKSALWGGKSFMFPNVDGMKVMTLRDFCPIYDEETGALRMGVYFYQIDDVHPITYTFYTEQGFYIFISTKGEMTLRQDLTAYMTRTSGVFANRTVSGENYKRLPIAQYKGNNLSRSELLPIKSKIDAYDMMQNGFINDLDNADFYWLIENASASDNEDLIKFRDQLKSMHMAALEGDTHVRAETIDIPYAAREQLLQRLEAKLYEDYMAVDIQNIASGAATATQIKAAYTPLKIKASDFESCTRNFLYDLLDILGIDDKPTFDPDPLINTAEEVNTIISSYNAALVSREYATTKILSFLGDKDKIGEVEEQLARESMERMTTIDIPGNDEGDISNVENNNNN